MLLEWQLSDKVDAAREGQLMAELGSKMCCRWSHDNSLVQATNRVGVNTWRHARTHKLGHDPRNGGAEMLWPAHAFQVPHYALLNLRGQSAKRHNQPGKAVISRKQVCHWHSQRIRQPLRRERIRLVHPAFVSVDACAGHKTIQPSGDSELLLRQPLPLPGLLQTSRQDGLWADFWGHDPNRAGETLRGS